MTRTAVICLALLVCLIGVRAAPQFGGSFSQANAQAGSFGGPYQRGFGYRGPPRPPGGFGRPGFGGNGFNNGGGGGSISISKSISISRGGSSSAQSSAGAFGK